MPVNGNLYVPVEFDGDLNTIVNKDEIYSCLKESAIETAELTIRELLKNWVDSCELELKVDQAVTISGPCAKRKITTVKMSEEILSVVIAVKTYKDFVIADKILKTDKTNIDNLDWYSPVFQYYKNLILPKGLKKSRACFDHIINNADWIVEKFYNMPVDELGNYVFSYEY